MKKGTAHLRDGQYVYQLGRHGTTHKEHMDAMIEMCASDENAFEELQLALTCKGISSVVAKNMIFKQMISMKRSILPQNAIFFKNL